MIIYTKLKEKDRIKLFLAAKKESRNSWNFLYPKLNVSRSMFFKYLSGKYAIPEELFLKLETIADVNVDVQEFIAKEKYLQKKISSIQMNNSLAEILGVINGDGHMNTLTYELCITGSILEKDYYNYLKILFEKNLGLSFKIYELDRRIRLKVYSKALVEILSESYGLPLGNKTGKLRAPRIIFRKSSWVKSYLKGLFDTDGSFYTRRKMEPVVNISSADFNFLKEICKMLSSFNLKYSLTEKNVYLYNRADIDRFFKLIKPSNSKHLKKYKQYLNHKRR